MTIASLQAIFAFADFGLGNGVLNTVAEAFGRGDVQLISRAVRSALVLQSLVAAILLAAFWAVSELVNWPGILHVSGAIAAREVRPAILIFATIFFLRSVVQVVQQAQYGLQMGFVANAWTAGGNLLALLGLVLAAKGHAGVPILCLIVSGLPVLSGALNAIWWLTTRMTPGPDPGSGAAAEKNARLLSRMMHVGLLFFLLQVGAALNLGIDPLIVNQVLGPRAVATFAVVQKPFELLSTLLVLLLQPLWPAYREAITSGDMAWVTRTFRRAMVGTLAFSSCVALIMAVGGPALIRIWAGPSVHPSEALILAYCAAHLFLASQAPLAVFLNGLGKIRFQLLLGIPVIGTSLALKIVLSSRFGLPAIPLATVIVGLGLMIPAEAVYLRHLTRNVLRETVQMLPTGQPPPDLEL
jgi:O-antigen/teichoic acid export membrane protein